MTQCSLLSHALRGAVEVRHIEELALKLAADPAHRTGANLVAETGHLAGDLAQEGVAQVARNRWRVRHHAGELIVGEVDRRHGSGSPCLMASLRAKQRSSISNSRSRAWGFGRRSSSRRQISAMSLSTSTIRCQTRAPRVIDLAYLTHNRHDIQNRPAFS